MSERQLIEQVSGLAPKGKVPASARVLETWIAQASRRFGMAGPRLGWLVASSIVATILGEVVDDAGVPIFLVKGGTALQYRLGGSGRTTRDFDGLVRGDFADFFARLDGVIAHGWPPFDVERTDVEEIEVPSRLVNPRRFDMVLKLRGVRWRRVQIEIGSDEAGAGEVPELVNLPSLKGFGLDARVQVMALSLAYQVAQKLHAVSDPHCPPDEPNDRARDLMDLVLLRELCKAAEVSDREVRLACEAVFRVRAEEAKTLGRSPRVWPPNIVAYPHWSSSFVDAADSAGVVLTLESALSLVQSWARDIEQA
ncbi:hypothetical protein J2S49_000759 [Arcanobacterium wilhelmae]|uniref:Nucleotidyl transferase AbiEii/AbiGii toxin family protein n=1 Tax=Arcanobacterium wilhelmae TaxID=1803177 RepID=A0ABT9NAG4_9ACTO|nr:nucleotidyl transferase AbiEii/AbiGii toxin family protein [Arcanobacterium wilhelmae]MDP9800683.1 hypothetical protein [Arcanobacterium wilhelmae]WFN90083.1 nucleotidyl transferase AbiEii/AbiGii toxin family protein [Arcanobacterium wilhelmae]